MDSANHHDNSQDFGIMETGRMFDQHEPHFNHASDSSSGSSSAGSVAYWFFQAIVVVVGAIIVFSGA